MFQHHLLLIYRNIIKAPGSFLINLIGLSTGLACTLLIYLWVSDELTIDKFYEKDNQLYQVMLRVETAGGIEVSKETPPILAETLLIEFPEVEFAVTEVVIPTANALSNKEKDIKASGVYAGKDYFNVFSYKLIQGNKDQVLSDANNILISENLARKLFNSTDNLLGKTVVFEHQEQFLISGIFKIPSNSSRQFDFILPHKAVFTHFPNLKNDWSNSMWSSYLILKEKASPAEFNSKIKGFISSKTRQEHRSLFATPYSDQYLYGSYENGIQSGGRIEYVKLFALIATFILIIACINYMNLATAKASVKMKEVGIKKAVGAGRQSLITQYLSESILMVVLSLLIAILLMVFFLPSFNDITGKHLSLYFDTNLILAILCITLITGLVSGSYPALYLSGFNPAKILKGGAITGRLNNSFGELWARKGLVIFQFTLSIVLMVAVLVVYKQIEYVQNNHLGYNKENIIYFETKGKVKEHLEPFLAEVKSIPGIVNASSTFMTFLGNLNSTSDISWPGKSPDQNVQMQYRRVNYDMLELLEITMKKGRTFSKAFNAEDTKIIFNEAAIKQMSLEKPIGKSVKLWGRDYEIAGVVENFHFESFREKVKPLFVFLSPERTNTVMLKIDSKNLAETLTNFENYFNKFTEGMPLAYNFLDEVYQAQYMAEQRVSLLSRYFAGFAILISCLGLFGLATFTAQKRRKEIGIRKALGSSDLSIVYLLSRDFTKLVSFAIIMALPISYFVTSYWLNGFAYRIKLELWYFIAAGLLALVVAWLTVGMQAIRAANINPVKALKYE